MDSEFYTLKECASIFNVHINTIRRAVKRGHLIAIRVGLGKRSPYRISKKSIEEIHRTTISLLYKDKVK